MVGNCAVSLMAVLMLVSRETSRAFGSQNSSADIAKSVEVTLVDAVFGPRLLSWRRVISSTFAVGLLICVAYVCLEVARMLEGMPLRPPVVGLHWNTGFPLQVIPAMISISIMRFLIAQSIARLGKGAAATCIFWPSSWPLLRCRFIL